ncbi:MAG: Tad domain-containing protein [Candidatus Limnocylindria bacterium]
MRRPAHRHPHPAGQVLVIVALGLVAIIAMVGLVIDGGYAWGRQRGTQNGVDAVAKAGTIVVQHWLAESGSPNDWNVACAVEGAAVANGVTVESAEYTNHLGQPLVPPVPVGTCAGVDTGVAIPTGAQGVKASASQTFDTFLMRVVGFDELTATANATAVVGTPNTVPGGALPVTFPVTAETCDSLETDTVIKDDNMDGTWEPYEIIEEEDADITNLALVPLCTMDADSNSSVGWLDYDCGQNLSEAVSEPCQKTISIPAWIHTQTGNVNSLADELNGYTGPQIGVAEVDDEVLWLPIHVNTCSEDPGDPLDSTCAPLDSEQSGEGDNLYYYVRTWVGFKLDAAYVQGGDNQCKQPPGKPVLVLPQPPGQVGCLKGWFVDRADEPGSVELALINPGDPVRLQVVLID